MPYVFAFFVFINVVALGYFVLIHDDSVDISQQKSELIKPIAFENTTQHVPPVIGDKK